MSLEFLSGDKHDTKLVENTHPANRPNPKPQDLYDLVVIGGGTAGLVTAAGSAGLGARVALVERAHMGGDCLNVGCVPSKGVIRPATAIADVRAAGGFGVNVKGDVEMDFGAAMDRMRKIRAHISDVDSVERYSNELGVEVFIGDATFSGPNTVDVDGTTLAFSRAVIATGARASAPPIPGLDKVDYLTNENIFNLTELPKSMIVIGAGPIGCEMAQSFQRFGCDVTLIELADQVLIREDKDAALLIQEALVKDGITLALRAEKILDMNQADGEIRVNYYCGIKKTECEVAGEKVLVAVGRAPNIDGLGLENVGVEYDKRAGVKVDDRLQTSNPRIFAAGDICSMYKFTHAADFLARIVIANALFGQKQKASDLVIPWCTYTDPQLAHVGLTEATAAKEGVSIDTYTQPFEDVDRALLDGETEGFVKIHCAKGSDRIVGATIVARHAGDMIGELVMAMKYGLGLGKVSSVIHPYPTQGEAIRKVGDIYNRTRLTPLSKKVLGFIMKFRRKKH